MMKDKLKYLKSYAPWLLILFAFDVFAAILLWLADIRIFQALFVLLILTTVTLFLAVCFACIKKEKKKTNALRTFFLTPDENTKMELIKMFNPYQKEIIEDMADAFYQRQEDIEKANTLLSEYEDYVETWTHEIKLPLSLLTIVLDNQSDVLPKDIALKLDYVRNQIQENISQILFYYRVRGEKNDFLFGEFDLKDCINEVLEDFKPLLDEKEFEINLVCMHGSIYTDRRSFEFIVGQIIGNTIKYSRENPKLCISMKKDENRTMLSFKDNGCGVKACDLPHVFDKGFTGDSGDARKKSTGMGLYIVKQLSNNLKIDIKIKSDWMQGFEIMLYI